MNTIKRQCKPKRELSERTRRKSIERKRRKVWAMEITLPEHELEDFTKFVVHRYTLDPDVMAVRTAVEINQHDLVKVDGETLKVVSVEDVAPGCVELRCLKFGRYQR